MPAARATHGGEHVTLLRCGCGSTSWLVYATAGGHILVCCSCGRRRHIKM